MVARAFLADLDGTLADSVSVLRDVYRRFMHRMDRPESDAEFERLKGPPLAQVVAQLRLTHGLSQSERELLHVYRALVDAAYAEVAAMPHAPEVLMAAKRSGWIVGVVTSNGTVRTRAWLERTNLLPYVDLVISGDDVARGKPDPEPYRLALQRAGAAPGSSIAVEDSPQGATAARAAGLKTFLLLDSGNLALQQRGVRGIRSLAELLPFLKARAMPVSVGAARF
jgi:HAD superfamily hydrolase (TIGR01509 family)